MLLDLTSSAHDWQPTLVKVMASMTADDSPPEVFITYARAKAKESIACLLAGWAHTDFDLAQLMLSMSCDKAIRDVAFQMSVDSGPEMAIQDWARAIRRCSSAMGTQGCLIVALLAMDLKQWDEMAHALMYVYAQEPTNELANYLAKFYVYRIPLDSSTIRDEIREEAKSWK